MKNRKIFWGLIVAAILAIAFFMQGNYEVVPLSPEDMKNDVENKQEITASSGEGTVVQEKSEMLTTKEEVDQKEEAGKESDKEPITDTQESRDKEQPKDTDKEQPNKEQPNKEQPNKEQPKDIKETIKEQKELKQKIIAEDNKNRDKKDKYLTDPVPEGKPKPVEWQDVTVDKGQELTATLSITCKTILNNMPIFNMKKLEVLPEDGVIYPTQTVTFYEGESVFDVLLREMQKNKIHMEFVMTPIYNSNYVAGIQNLYEFDCGELSGWMYRVNGWFPNYGASRYQLKDGDVIEWIYTCDLGRDIGGTWAVTGGEE